ncbi:MAG: molybdopterin-dependent oxidoreductase [Anaerolineae bacterium]
MAHRYGRRTFMRFLAAVVGASAVACGLRPMPEDGVTPYPTTEETLRSENAPADKPHWNVRFIKAFRALNRDAWRVTVAGLVAQPRTFSLAELQALPSVTQVSRMVCVEGWSSKAEWVGFTYASLAALVQPEAEAGWLHFRCADDYYEVLSIAEADADRVLFVYGMDGELLPSKFGGPLRVIFPPRYGYKGPKSILRITFEDKGVRGYWSTVGPYSDDGEIQPGVDYALDLQERREIPGGQEVTEY